jgi:tetrapyrrole methylase family protein/MazG family protein
MNKHPFDTLVEIMDRLRDPGGCPWDREQNHDSLKPYLIEEAYEVMEAIDSGKPDLLREELGDLLFQVVFHARLTKERGAFTIDDVIRGISEKMVDRHPHVFADGAVKDARHALTQWEEIKKAEEKNRHRESVLDGIPKTLPALLRAQRIQGRAARVGFDWEHQDQVFEKVEEEMSELREAFRTGDVKEVEHELGDLLFTLVNLSRFLKINPEEALQKTIRKFMDRFRQVEKEVERQGRDWKDVSLREMDALWDRAKEMERGPSSSPE